MAEKRATRIVDMAIVVTSVAMAVYHMIATQYLLWGVFQHQAMHLGFAMTLVFLGAMRPMKWRNLWNLAVLLVGVVVMAYILFNFERLYVVVGFLPTPIHAIIGILLVFVVIEVTRQAWGWILPIVALIFIGYYCLGQYIPAPLGHHGFLREYIISSLGIGFQGIFGVALGVSANMVFLFLLFGGLLWGSGAVDFVLELAKVVGRRLASGPALVAVVSSALVGMVTGAAVANVALTGSFTIPLMKKTGYRPEIAAAVEATASTGAQITPPVMGETAFLLASFLRIPYVRVMLAGIIPALLYFIPVFLGVEVIARRDKIPRAEIAVDRGLLISRAPCFIIPLLVIFTILILRFTPSYAAFYGIISIIVVASLRKETRFSLSTLISSVVRGATMGARVGVVLACVGLMYVTMTATALGVKLGAVVAALGADLLFPALVLTMAVAILLGCGVVVPAVYCIVVLMVGPVLTKLGVMLLPAHFFVFFFAVISAITPPVAVASLAGASIAGASFWKTSVNAIKLASVGFLIPFLIVYNPVLVLEPGGSAWSWLVLPIIVMGLICIVVSVFGHFFTEISYRERCLYSLATISLFGYCFTHHYLLLVLGVLLFIGLMLGEWRKVRTQRQIKAGLPM